MSRAPHIYVVGQTASGKTGFSLELSEKLGLEILNTDSLLFYKDLSIGTAKPSQAELKKVKHHLIDICEVGEELTASNYEKKAEDILKKSACPMLCVGGSGFYIKALDVGLLPLPETDLNIKSQVEKIEDPVADLKDKDKVILNKISENDLYRVRRALEVFYQTGKPLSKWQEEFTPKPFAKKLAFEIERPELKKRIEMRADQMLKEGLVEEVESLLKKNPEAKNWKPLHSVGYEQVLHFLEGQYDSLEKMKEDIVIRTMQLSKRQKTWFKKDKTVTWFDLKDHQKAKDFVIKSFEEHSWRA